jgi:hypothetical protein
MQKILVTISGYYERFMINTIESCIKRAAFPERISFAIAYHEDHILDTSNITNRISRYVIPKGDKIGVQKPKHILSKMIRDEDFVLSIDSHVVLMPNWDTEMIKDYEDRVSNAENKNIIISGNFGDSEQLGWLDYDECLKKYFNNDSFFNQKKSNKMSEIIVDSGKLYDLKHFEYSKNDWYGYCLNQVPVMEHLEGAGSIELTNSYSGNFSFIPSKWFKEYNFTEHVFFSADQVETSMNMYTSGYDIWAPRYKYHCHMIDHKHDTSSGRTVVSRFNNIEFHHNRYFDLEKDYAGIQYILGILKNDYNNKRPRTIKQWMDFHKLDHKLYE